MTIATCNSNPINNRLNNRLKRLPGQAAEMRASRPLSRASGRRRAAAMCRSTGTTFDTPPYDRIAAGENAAIGGAIADRHHPFRVRRRGVSALQRLAHVLGDRAGHQQHVGMARRGDEAQAEALEIVEGVVERVDLELAAIAGAGIDLADGEAAAELPPRGAIEICRKLGQGRVVGRRRAARSAGRRITFLKRSLRMFVPRGRGPNRSS